MAFSFNIGSFLGGAAKAGSQRIDEVRANTRDDLLTSEAKKWQIATEARADARARTTKREDRARETEEYIGTMVALGMDLDTATAQAKNGVGAVKVAIDTLKYGRKNGVDTAGFYKLKAAGNVPITEGEISEISQQPSVVIDTEAIQSMYGATDSDVGTHNEAILKLTNQQLALDLSTDKGKASFDSLEVRKNAFLKDIGTIATRKDTSTRLFSTSTVRGNIDAARSRALSTYEMTLNIENNIIGNLQGRGVQANIANLDAAKFLRGSLSTSKLEDEFMNQSIVMLESQAVANIKNLGYEKLRTDTTPIVPIENLSSETDRTLTVGEVIKVPVKDPQTGAATGTFTYSIYTGTKDANNYIILYTGE